MQVYGADHSPWVQAVLLGLHAQKHAYTLTTVPPLALLFKSGVMMPAAKTSDTPWLLESADILQQIGFGEVVDLQLETDKNHRLKADSELSEGVFLGYCIHPGYRWRGEYYVAPLHEFVGEDLHRDAPPSKCNVKVETIREIIPPQSPQSITFPLKAEYDRRNQTLEGLKQGVVEDEDED